MIVRMTDRTILYIGAFLRSLATGMIGVLVGIHLARQNFDAATIGYVIASGLAGGALATLVITLVGDRAGRRRSLVILASLSAAGGMVFAMMTHPLAAGAVAFVGMVNGMGRDRGASSVLDQAILPATTTPGRRTAVFAWYNVLQDTGGALGGLLAGAPALLRSLTGLSDVPSLRLTVILYASIHIVVAVLYLRLSPALENTATRDAEGTGTARTESPNPSVEHQPVERQRPATVGIARVSPATRRVLFRISALFSLDSLAGGLLTTAMLSFFFLERFGVGEGILGPLFFGARAANALSHPVAAWLAGRWGLVNTMVFTHIPANLLLIAVAYAPSFPIAAALFILREGLVEMDVPTRQSYVMAVVRPEERTVAAGVTNLVRVSAWSVGPSFAGLFMKNVSLATPLVLGSLMKVFYDLLLFGAFRKVRPPEERTGVPED